MENLEIDRPKLKDIKLINEFFTIVILDTFKKNDILDLVDIMAEEIENKGKFIKQDIDSNGEDRYFLIAKVHDKIVGSIEYGPANELITSYINGENKKLLEIGTVFVHPEYQNKGIGSRMINGIFMELSKKGMKQAFLDSGYKSAQKIWIKKFGIPKYNLKDYWGEGDHHMIWEISIDEENI